MDTSLCAHQYFCCTRSLKVFFFNKEDFDLQTGVWLVPSVSLMQIKSTLLLCHLLGLHRQSHISWHHHCFDLPRLSVFLSLCYQWLKLIHSVRSSSSLFHSGCSIPLVTCNSCSSLAFKMSRFGTCSVSEMAVWKLARLTACFRLLMHG